MLIPVPEAEQDPVYPDSDGRPVAESDFQFRPLTYSVEALRQWFREREDVYAAGNMLLYYEEGNPKACVAPDVFVVLGAPKHDRRSYMLWKEPKAPSFVLEITSKSTVSEDQGVKRGIYAFLGVDEYWQYDPTGDYLKPPLAGFRLVEGNYWPIPVRAETNGSLTGDSRVLALSLRLDARGFHFVDPASGSYLPTYAESQQARIDAEQARQQAEQAQLQAEQAQQQAEQAQLQAEQGLQQADRARQQAEQAQQQAETRAAAEEALRLAAERRIAELEARLKGQAT